MEGEDGGKQRKDEGRVDKGQRKCKEFRIKGDEDEKEEMRMFFSYSVVIILIYLFITTIILNFTNNCTWELFNNQH